MRKLVGALVSGLVHRHDPEALVLQMISGDCITIIMDKQEDE